MNGAAVDGDLEDLRDWPATDDSGRFATHAPIDRDTWLTFHGPRPDADPACLPWGTPVVAVAVPAAADSTAAELNVGDLVQPEPVTLRVRVVGPHGEPLRDANVAARFSGATGWFGGGQPVNDRGEAEFSGPAPGDYDIDVEVEDRRGDSHCIGRIEVECASPLTELVVHIDDDDAQPPARSPLELRDGGRVGEPAAVVSAAPQTESDSAAAVAPSRVVAVLGMHRSGTSFLAGSLEACGLQLGEVSTENPHNRRGNREHPELMSMHDAVLAANDGSWKKPPRRRAWPVERAAELRAFVERMNAAHPLWGFKDPRALLLYAEWEKALPHLERVGIFRHPLAVHRSLAARNARFDERRSVRLWCDYNECLVRELRRASFPLMRFDVPPDRLLAQLQDVVATLRLPDASSPDAFFDPALVHQHDGAEEPVPRACRKLWAELIERAA